MKSKTSTDLEGEEEDSIMDRMSFFRESIKNIKTTGTIIRSSRYLCKTMIRPVDFQKAKCIVELGAGDGVVTQHILDEMKSDAILFSFEILETMYDRLTKIEDSRFYPIKGSAENIIQHLKTFNFEQTDYVVSALPMVAFPDDLTNRILEEIKTSLKPGGKYIQINYSLLKRKKYKEVFGNVKVHFSPLNIPPAFVFICEKE